VKCGLEAEVDIQLIIKKEVRIGCFRGEDSGNLEEPA
jgi:hypothetical protein